MKIHGQRWRYQLANTELYVDNAFSWFGWAQERALVNGKMVQSAGGWLIFRRSFKESWLTPTGDGELTIAMHSAASGIVVEVKLGGAVIEHEELFEATWHGRGGWPSELDWNRTEQFTIFNFLKRD
ncbi:hypothetical protein [Aurantiacibacter marinus]|uniref:Uncharacterized protein n=1 Tax=Aurantiacibacter marinus TaxID=874156 RepID=A0A0H0XNX0_9SPHN|nr:hypothetical protein [Aurantiacibacter marinus]KLI63647.1 hypothetical protein AAV99_07865 [Aurantiacibacter marinus]